VPHTFLPKRFNRRKRSYQQNQAKEAAKRRGYFTYGNGQGEETRRQELADAFSLSLDAELRYYLRLIGVKR